MEGIKELCERARSALNLMLVMALAQIWASNAYDVTPGQVQTRIRQVVVAVAGVINKNHPTPKEVELLQKYFDTEAGVADPQEAQLWVPLSVFNGLPVDEVRVGLKSSKKELDEWAKEMKLKGKDDATIAAGRAALESYNGETVAKGLLELKRYIFDSGLSPTAVTGDLIRSYRRTIKIPVIEHDIDVNSASLLIGVAQIGPAVFLFVVMNNIWILVCSRKKDQPRVTSFDLVLLYRGDVAFLLSTFWLLLPIASMYLGIRSLSNVLLGVAYAIFLAVPLGFVMSRMFKIRRAAFGEP